MLLRASRVQRRSRSSSPAALVTAAVLASVVSCRSLIENDDITFQGPTGAGATGPGGQAGTGATGGDPTTGGAPTTGGGGMQGTSSVGAMGGTGGGCVPSSGGCEVGDEPVLELFARELVASDWCGDVGNFDVDPGFGEVTTTPPAQTMWQPGAPEVTGPWLTKRVPCGENFAALTKVRIEDVGGTIEVAGIAVRRGYGAPSNDDGASQHWLSLTFGRVNMTNDSVDVWGVFNDASDPDDETGGATYLAGPPGPGDPNVPAVLGVCRVGSEVRGYRRSGDATDLSPLGPINGMPHPTDFTGDLEIGLTSTRSNLDASPPTARFDFFYVHVNPAFDSFADCSNHLLQTLAVIEEP